MNRLRDAPAGCLVYFMLSILINLFILMLRISAHEIQNNSMTVHGMDGADVISIETSTDSMITSSTDASNKKATDSLDLQQIIPSHELSENSTVQHRLVAASLVLHKPDTPNGIRDVDSIDTAIATTAQPSNASGTLADSYTLQRNASISRDLLSSRAVIKSSSPSAIANNNTATQKQHKPDAPMLNYIFDSHLANKHRHYDPRYGPHFDDVHITEKVANVSAQLGSIAYLNCRIRRLEDKTVTWLKREQNNSHIQLLTIGVHTYTFDKRFSVDFESPNNWRLRIADTNKSDEGLYECQISTHPPRAIRTQFHVKSPEVMIVDEFEQPLVDKYYEVDSTIELTCIVRHASMFSSTVQWMHGNQLLNFDMTRGGISVKTDLMENGANSTLCIAKVRKTDTGNYTCSIDRNYFHTINIQVLKGESLAELYHGSAVASPYQLTRNNWIAMFICTIIILGINLSASFSSDKKPSRRNSYS